MTSENDILETQNKYIRVLNTIYKFKKQGRNSIDISEIKDSTLQGIELPNILLHLQEEGWIKHKSSIKNLENPKGNAVSVSIEITDTGVLYIENEIKKAKE
jgi:hypothetical protein